uniref:small ubiquitin-related modifier 1 n=1 Tax=Erigeron canadensis TaxID=72917 RepID=UPI001CB88C9D|nr:small ubiquitin-related modifier 1 [Erigeron canadensis]XP_043607948.1 small ubiquitin-related modifier 1 [Erigeron canadensis]XP_043607949.1 small ubiquitin-related modifier 1 [Erigeron canadensis]
MDPNKKMSKINEDNNNPTHEDQASAKYIKLNIKNQEGEVVFFKVGRHTRFRKLINAYCDRESEGLVIYAFLFNGRRIRPEQTPDELHMEDGDGIDAMKHRVGGGWAKDRHT